MAVEYGLRLRDSSGNIILDAIDKINRVAFAEEKTAGDDDSAVVASIAGLKTTEMAYAKNVTDFLHSPLIVTRSGTTIAWEPYGWGPLTPRDSLIIVFIYV